MLTPTVDQHQKDYLDRLVAAVGSLLVELYGKKSVYPLHEPLFGHREKRAVCEAVESSFVSSVGKEIVAFESAVASYTGSEAAVAVVNGTSAIHASLVSLGITTGDLVITQPLTFVATCNAISYTGAEPLFLDVDRESFALDPISLSNYLEGHAYLDDQNTCRLISDNRAIKACLVVHTFGHSANVSALKVICNAWKIILIEDAAESLGTLHRGQHTGTFGDFGVLSFNGNKVITTGGGGMILTSEENAGRIKHLTTTAKQPHSFEYFHDQLGFNYRMPNLNAALGLAQLDSLPHFLKSKRVVAQAYEELFVDFPVELFSAPNYCSSNFWLNTVIFNDKNERDYFLAATNSIGVMTRPCWTLMTDLPMYASCLTHNLKVATSLSERIVNLPSSPICYE